MSNKDTTVPNDEMQLLCKMAASTLFTDLPTPVVNQAKRAILDTLAVTIGGSAMEGIESVVNFVKDKGGKAESLVPFYGGKVPASEAGLAIGPMSRAMDFGDVNMVAGHSSEYILPALLAATGLKAKVTGKEFITAFVVGSEVLIRTGLLAQPGKSMVIGRDGGHYIFGCVAAVAKLLDLSLDELEQAQGIASAMTQPHSILMYNPPTLMVRVHHGFICQAAINACLLAKRGITGPRTGVLSSPEGYAGFVHWETDVDAVTKDLGKRWEMMNLTIKRYPIAASASMVIDGMLEQKGIHKFRGQDIHHIDLDLDPKLAERITKPEAREAQWHPETPHHCQFSVPYGLATAAYDGSLFLDSYTEKARSREEVRNLMTRIAIAADPSLTAYAARIHITLDSGEKFSGEYVLPKGHPLNPLTDEELIEKFNKCVPYSAFALSRSVADKIIRTVLELEKSDDVVLGLIAPLTPA